MECDFFIKEGDDNNSFVLKVALEYSDKVKDLALWPKGVYMRRYYPARK